MLTFTTDFQLRYSLPPCGLKKHLLENESVVTIGFRDLATAQKKIRNGRARATQGKMGDTPHNLPCPSGVSVTVSVLNNCFLRGVPTAPYVEPIRPGHETFNDLPCLVFLIENSAGRKVLFDLGLRKDWEKLSPVSLTEILNDKIHIVLEEDIVDILQRGGIEPGEIEAVVLSHHHWDHVGDLSLFPETTRVVIGPGFLEAFRLGYPDDALAPLLASDFSGKSVDEINFERPNCIPVGPFTAFDYFGDGSFYLIDAPGNSIGHIGAIARTTSNPDTFVFMGADSCHHCGEFRPSERRPTPSDFGLSSPTSVPSAPCSRPTSDQRKDPPRRLCGTPFYSVTRDPRYAEYTRDHNAADETIVKVQEMDGYDNVFVIMAHDDCIPKIVDIFPKHINQWKSQKWNETGRWTFLSDWNTFDLAGAKVGSWVGKSNIRYSLQRRSMFDFSKIAWIIIWQEKY